MKKLLLAIITICLIVTISVSAYAINFSADNKVVTNPRLHLYPRYRNEMDAGELADVIHERLGFKLKADFEGDRVDGSVTVSDTNVIIEFYHDIELTQEQKAELNEIVQSHYSKSVEMLLRRRAQETGNESHIENEVEPLTSNPDPRAGEAHSTSLVSTTSVTWISLLEIPPLEVHDMIYGYHLFTWLSVEAKNTQSRIDFRIRRGIGTDPTNPFYDKDCPSPIYYFGKDPTNNYWIRTLHEYIINRGYYFGYVFVRSDGRWLVELATPFIRYIVPSSLQDKELLDDSR